ncbi:uncharacterized protein LOC143288582 [Babylonia areolata]|uniref:uncharacterized protein LOC143288582 n=1 Tax=Babylonia areolata TaxID=304850 RepID=UPI003FD5DCC7
MEEIEAFVRKLCAEGDLGILTKKLIRTQYQAHFNKTTVTREEKDKINEVLETVIQELADQSKSKKRKAAALAAFRDAKDDQPLNGGELLDITSQSDDSFEEDTPVKAKKPQKKRKRLQLESSDEEEDLPLRPALNLVDAEEVGKKSRADDDLEVSFEPETDPLPSVKRAKKRKMKQQTDSSDDDDQPLKPRSVTGNEEKEESGQDDHSAGELSGDDSTPLKPKRAKKRKMKQQTDSSDDDDQPLKPRSVTGNEEKEESGQDDHSAGELSGDDSTPLKPKRAKKKMMKQQTDSSDDDDQPLKPRSVTGNEEKEESGQDDHSAGELSGDDSTPLKPKRAKKRMMKQQTDSSDDDDQPLKPRSVTGNEEKEESGQDDHSAGELSGDDSTPLKPKVSLKAPKLVFMSSDDGLSPMKVKLKPSQDDGSDLDTSSLSSEGENEAQSEPTKPRVPKLKFTMKKVQPTEKAKSEKAKTEKGSKAEKAAPSEKEESPHLKRLRLICRKVGIFVRSDVHFAGCSSDKQKIDRLKEALRKAGMKGQPSLSKVDSVNLRREAEDLDTTNIIETSDTCVDAHTKTHEGRKEYGGKKQNRTGKNAVRP